MKKLILPCLLVMGLVGCATESHKGQGVPSLIDSSKSSASDAQSIGAGERGGFNENAAHNGQRDPVIYMAPHSQTVHFNFDRSSIQEEDRVTLGVQAKYLRAHPNAKIVLAGHTDEIGSREYNVALSERRAKSVSEFMRFAGIKPSQVRLVSYGQEKPVALGHNQAAYKQNRRVELSYEVS